MVEKKKRASKKEKPKEIKQSIEEVKESDIKEFKESSIERIEENIEEKREDKNLINEPNYGLDINEVKVEDLKNTNTHKDLETIQDQQIKWAVFLMASIILIIVLVPFIKLNYLDRFEYNGLIFQKTKLGDITFFSSKFPIVNSITGRVIGDYAINLRNDPRKLDYIPINTTDKKIQFATDVRGYGPVYISLNPLMKQCEDTGIALLALSGFLRDSGLKVNSAVTDIAYANKHNLTQRWCHNDRYDTVLIYTDGNETKITEIYPNCYEVAFNNCEVQQATEKFMLVILEDYASQFKSS